MGTNSGTILPFSHQINDIEQNRLRIGSKFGLAYLLEQYSMQMDEGIFLSDDMLKAYEIWSAG